ncbi:hypothetical protein [Staphylococcus epidermidis]|uniref:hypothetical protein n=1 Tax=Staphylococcus epidermidis TaxID=1282 RepID=UPI001D0D50E6|nr:hypothetical protein [Staphylococcus epidermidis]MCC2070776.1 hypothetical protein [Staphylococcus epidermidis]
MAEDPKFVVHGSQVQKWTDDIQQLKQERDAYKKQRDELINDMAEVKRKAEAFDEIVKSLDKSDSPEDFGELVWEILLDYGVIHNEG